MSILLVVAFFAISKKKKRKVAIIKAVGQAYQVKIVGDNCTATDVTMFIKLMEFPKKRATKRQNKLKDTATKTTIFRRTFPQHGLIDNNK